MHKPQPGRYPDFRRPGHFSLLLRRYTPLPKTHDPSTVSKSLSELPAMLTQGNLYHDRSDFCYKPLKLLGKLAFSGKAGKSHILCGLPSVGQPVRQVANAQRGQVDQQLGEVELREM